MPDAPNEVRSMEFGVVREATPRPADEGNDQMTKALVDQLFKARVFGTSLVRSGFFARVFG